jgi:3-oxoacyl-[acyl-carrier protein] reductase
MDLGLTGRVALVTGASKGLGRGIAAALVAEGAKVAIASRSAERIEATAREIGARGYVFDADDPGAVPDLLERVQGDLGPIDVYVANTGGPPAGPDPLAFTREQWEAAHRSLVLTPMAFLERLLPGMRERGFGRVVAIGSMAVSEPIDNLQLSNAHRPGLVAAFKVLARQCARDNVTLNHVHPGRIATDRMIETEGSREAAEELARRTIPAARLGTVEELAAAAVFLCSAPAGYITGTSLLVDGGLTRGIS